MTDTCVCCGEIIPEGRMVCPVCEDDMEQGVIIGVDHTAPTEDDYVTWIPTPKGHALAAAREAGLINDLNDPRFERFWEVFSESVDSKNKSERTEKFHGETE